MCEDRIEVEAIRTDNASFLAFDRLQSEALDFWVVLEAASVGYPLAFGYWFEYVDEDLDISAWENALSWTFPEIPPRIGVYVDLDAQTVQEDVRRFFALPQQFRSDLKRSMNRFVSFGIRPPYVCPKAPHCGEALGKHRAPFRAFPWTSLSAC